MFYKGKFFFYLCLDIIFWIVVLIAFILVSINSVGLTNFLINSPISFNHLDFQNLEFNTDSLYLDIEKPIYNYCQIDLLIKNDLVTIFPPFFAFTDDRYIVTLNIDPASNDNVMIKYKYTIYSNSKIPSLRLSLLNFTANGNEFLYYQYIFCKEIT